jgi:hypothetical protein
MKNEKISSESIIKWIKKNCITKGVRIIPQYDEEGADTELMISAKNANPKNIACPYCGGADNILVIEKPGQPATAWDCDRGDYIEITTDWFRCASCFRIWIKVNFDKDRAIAVGFKSEMAKDRAN